MRRAAGLLLLTALAGSAAATEPEHRCWPWSCWPPLRPCPTCLDDYCAKPLPCVPAKVCGGADDYCPKPLPTVRPVCCKGPDDYCAKPCPKVERCWCPPWLTCVPCTPGPR
jgi:hypothetical protein